MRVTLAFDITSKLCIWCRNLFIWRCRCFLLVNGSQFLQNEQWYLIVFAVFDLRKDDDLQSIHFWLSDQRKEQLHKIEFVIIICRGWTVSYLFGFPMNTWAVNLHNSEDSSTTGAITDKMRTASNFSHNVKMCRPSKLEKWENPVKLKKAIISVVAPDCPCNGHANKTLFADCQKSRWLRQLQKVVWSIQNQLKIVHQRSSFGFFRRGKHCGHNVWLLDFQLHGHSSRTTFEPSLEIWQTQTNEKWKTDKYYILKKQR